jgi:hypothetical protein
VDETGCNNSTDKTFKQSDKILDMKCQ